jgi:hypothetical protein
MPFIATAVWVVLSGVVISVLAFANKVCGFKPCQGLLIFKGDKIIRTPSFGGELKPLAPCRETDSRGRVGNTPVSYSGGPGFHSRPRRTVILILVYRGLPQSLQANAGIVP